MLLLLLACGGPEKCPSGCADTGDPGDDTGGDPGDDTGTEGRSAGCGRAVDLPAGGVQRTLDAGAEGGGERGYWLSLPADYDPDRPHALVLGYAGTNWTGVDIQPYLDLERHASVPTVFVYPDPLWRSFDGWGTYGGWVLGPWAVPADGWEDLAFTEALIDALADELCLDPDRVSATGHSWGGDMAAVVGCFLADRVYAVAPAAANEPYWFAPDDPEFACTGAAAVWTWFGEADDHFTWQDHPGEFGEAQDAFWAEEHGCAGEEPLAVDGGGECVAHTGCSADTRYCLYPPATGHQVPRVFAAETMAWLEALP